MHPIWDIPELAQMIMEYLSDNDIKKLLCVSRRYFTLALPIAWEYADMDRLLQVYDGPDFPPYQEDISASRPMSDMHEADEVYQAYSRLSTYTRVVRKLSLPPRYHYRELELVECLLKLQRGECSENGAFPQLRELEVGFYRGPERVQLTAELLPTIQRLTLTDTLHSADLDYTDWYPDPSDLKNLVLSMLRAHNLIEFSDYGRTFHQLGAEAGAMFRALTKVTTVSFAELPTCKDILAGLISMPQLKELRQTDPWIDISSTIEVREIPDFVCLERLEIKDSPAYGAAFTLLSKAHTLQHVKIDTWEAREGQPEHVDVPQLCSLIARSKKTLETISIILGRTTVFTLSDTAPLLACLRINHVELVIYARMPHVTDQDFAQMAQSWPSLESISVKILYADGYFRPERHDLEATLDALYHFAAYCPKLDKIELHCLAARYTTCRSVPLHHAMLGRSLKLGLGTIWDAINPYQEEHIARFIGVLFPGRPILLSDAALSSSYLDAKCKHRIKNVQQCLRIQQEYYLALRGRQEFVTLN